VTHLRVDLVWRLTIHRHYSSHIRQSVKETQFFVLYRWRESFFACISRVFQFTSLVCMLKVQQPHVMHTNYLRGKWMNVNANSNNDKKSSVLLLLRN